MSNDFEATHTDTNFGEVSSDERTWAMLAHLSIIFPAIWLIGPLIVWLVKKESSAFVDDQAKEALNFHISVLIASLVVAPTCIGPFVVMVAAIVYGIIGGMEANKGIAYRYPYTFRLVK